MFVEFEKISNDARCWVYILEKPISKIKCKIEDFLKQVCQNWTSHKNEIIASFKIYNDQFIIMFAEDNISGCSIDNSYNLIKNKLISFNINVISNSNIGILQNNKISFFERSQLIIYVNNRNISMETEMINTTVKNKDDFNKNWILPLNKSWIVNFIK